MERGNMWKVLASRIGKGEGEMTFPPWCLFLTSSNFQARLPLKQTQAEETNEPG